MKIKNNHKKKQPTQQSALAMQATWVLVQVCGLCASKHLRDQEFGMKPKGRRSLHPNPRAGKGPAPTSSPWAI